MTIYDGTSIQSPSLGKYCGNSIPTSLVSTNNQLFLMFTTDSSVNGKGFMIEYSPASRLQESKNWTSQSFLCLFWFLELLLLKRKKVYDILGNKTFLIPYTICLLKVSLLGVAALGGGGKLGS